MSLIEFNAKLSSLGQKADGECLALRRLAHFLQDDKQARDARQVLATYWPNRILAINRADITGASGFYCWRVLGAAIL